MDLTILEEYERKHFEYVLNNAAESTLFLKKNGAFPLDKPCRIAAYGNGVRHTVKGGTGSGEVNSRFSINVEQGLIDAGFDITTKEWLDEFDQVLAAADDAFIKEIKAEARRTHKLPIMVGMGRTRLLPEYDIALSAEAECAIYVLSRDSGEGSDRKAEAGDVRLTASEIRDILELNNRYEKFMLVLNVGGVIDLSPVVEISNILLLSQLGVVTGTVLANILLGKANPSGKLSTTWASWEDYCTIGDFGDPDEVKYREGIYVGYRYFDSMKVKPLFPFGYGRGYTDFEISSTEVSNQGEIILVKTIVKNTGNTSGKEVVQIYISEPQGELDKAYQQLVGFAKTKELMPGEETVVEVQFKLSDIASYNDQSASYILERGLYLVRVGNSSDNTSVEAVISLDETVTTIQARNCLGKTGFKDAKLSVEDSISVPSQTKIINLSKSDFKLSIVEYDKEYPIEDEVKNLSDEDIVYLLTGGFNPKAGLVENVIGEASSQVAGAAGETTGYLLDRGIKQIVMADGPAGLRLSKAYFVENNVAYPYGTSSLPESMEKLATGFICFLMKTIGAPKKPKNGTEIKNQYCTAIPIGTAIAQTYNSELASAYGDIVGDEMERFGVHLWLAPALNIHRSILCGRNFEYYSEDPFVSGIMAAAITNGVQKHSGCGTTIKHYAANNAETNRYNSNSNVSERAMREIYLRGFKICVEKSGPHAVMTSYNLLNGKHTAEHKGLIEDILRCEYGYQGIVMTDWFVSMVENKKCKYRCAKSSEVAIGTGDIFMPGCKKDYADTLEALKSGRLTRKQAEICASRMYRMSKLLCK